LPGNIRVIVRVVARRNTRRRANGGSFAASHRNRRKRRLPALRMDQSEKALQCAASRTVTLAT
jgi:hypothetical protein